MKRFYGEIAKTESQEDGTIKVWGYASTDSVDSDGEIITSEALKNSLPGYMKFGAVREMHGSSAAGTAIEAKVLENGKTWFGAHVVDPVAVLKVKTGTYKGFSIGGRITERDEMNKNLIHGIDLVEISLVDRPANPEAVFTMFKADTVDNKDILNDNDKNINKGDNMTDEEKKLAEQKEIDAKKSKEEKEKVKKEDESEDLTDEEKEAKKLKDKEDESKKSSTSDGLEKGLSNVAWLSGILADLKHLHTCIAYEETEEKDYMSTIPAELGEVVKSLGAILVKTAAEEVKELESNLSPNIIIPNGIIVDESFAYNDKTTDLSKSSNLSKEDNEKLDLIKSLCKELGIVKEEDKEEVIKMNKVNEELSKALKINEDLTKRVKELESLPQVPKAVLVTVSKSDELGIEEDKTDVIYKSGTNEIDEVATAIKKSQKNGKRFM